MVLTEYCCGDNDSLKRTIYKSTLRQTTTTSKSTSNLTNLGKEPRDSAYNIHSFRVYKIPIHHHENVKSTERLYKECGDKYYTGNTRDYFKNYLYPKSMPTCRSKSVARCCHTCKDYDGGVTFSKTSSSCGTELPIRNLHKPKCSSRPTLEKCTEIHNINIRNSIRLPKSAASPHLELNVEIKTPRRDIRISRTIKNPHVRSFYAFYN